MEATHLPDNSLSRLLLLYILPFSYGAATRVPFVFASLHCVLVLGTSLPTLAGVLGCYQVRYYAESPSNINNTAAVAPYQLQSSGAAASCCPSQHNPSGSQHNPSTTTAHSHNSPCTGLHDACSDFSSPYCQCKVMPVSWRVQTLPCM
jgi:hypothetical protein